MKESITNIIFISSCMALLFSAGACTNVKFACKSTNMELRCPKNTVIYINNAQYGRTGYLATQVCLGINSQQNSICRTPRAYQVVFSRCNARQSCTIAVNDQLFGDACHGVESYLTVHYTCQQRVVACENERAYLSCPFGSSINIFHANFGRLLPEVCPGLNSNSTTSCRTFIAGSVAARCQSLRSCSVEATAFRFGDACRNVSKYLEIHYQCSKIPVKEIVRCNNKPLYIQCQRGAHIEIVHAEFGRRSPDFCPGANSTTTTTCQESSALNRVKLSCQGRYVCLIHTSTQLFGDPCPGVRKYLLVRYICANTPDPDQPTNPPAFA